MDPAGERCEFVCIPPILVFLRFSERVFRNPWKHLLHFLQTSYSSLVIVFTTTTTTTTTTLVVVVVVVTDADVVEGVSRAFSGSVRVCLCVCVYVCHSKTKTTNIT